jgi:hypothetical protein
MMNMTTYKLKASVKKGLMGAVVASSLFAWGLIALEKDNVNVEEVVFEKAYIAHGGSAYNMINKLNGATADKNKLMPLFEEKNKVASAGNIHEGYYLIPVMKEVK